MNEIAITMSERDFDFLREIMCDLIERSRGIKRKRLAEFHHRMCHNSSKLTLAWLSQKCAEFP